MIDVKKEGILLEKTDHEFENQAVLNPSIVQDGDTLHMFYRAVREGNFSSVGYAKLCGPLDVVERLADPVLEPSVEEDMHGVEDPRVVFFEGTYYIFYTAYDGTSARVGYATSTDMKNWEKQGIISPQISYHEAIDLMDFKDLKESYVFFQSYIEHAHGRSTLIWDKDAFIFPERIDGKIAFVHRILPDMQVAYVDSLKDLQDQDYWTEYLADIDDYILMENKYGHELRNIGGGGPPIRTEHGWLVIYHGVKMINGSKSYSACGALLDLENPQCVIGRGPEPLFIPEEEWELKGDVNNVVFPTGNAIFDDRLYMYYGAADSRIAAASVDIKELTEYLLSHKPDNQFCKDVRIKHR